MSNGAGLLEYASLFGSQPPCTLNYFTKRVSPYSLRMLRCCLELKEEKMVKGTHRSCWDSFWGNKNSASPSRSLPPV